MPDGSILSNLWNAASGTARAAANAISSGAQAVGKATLIAKDRVQSAATAAKQYAEQKAQQAEQYAVQKAQQAEQYAVRKAQEALTATKTGVRGAATGTLRGAAGAGASITHGVSSAKQSVGQAYDKARSVFTDKPADQPKAPCPCQNPVTDKDKDGLFVGYKDGKCVFLPRADKAPTEDDIQAAEDSAYVSDSTCCQNLRSDGKLQPPDRTIFYTNGINTTGATHCASLKAIGDSTCAKVVGVYNATDGMSKDLMEVNEDRRLVKQAAGNQPILTGNGRNPSVDTMSDLITTKVMGGQPPELWAHSQGGAITSLALYDAKNTLDAANLPGNNPLAGIKVTSMGSAAPSWPPGPSYEHYINVNDLTPTSFGLGASPKNDGRDAGPGAKVIRFGGGAGDPLTTDSPAPQWFPSMTAHHGVEDTYLPMERSEHPDCSCQPTN